MASIATVSAADASTKVDPTSELCSRAPSEKTCKNPDYLQCRGAQTQCRPILQSGFQQAFSGAVSRARYQDLDDTKDIVDGKTLLRSIPDTSVIAQGGVYSYAGQEQLAKAAAQKASVDAAPGYTRAPGWIESKAINSCAEYVYEKYYDYMRFVDAANSCKNDDGCVVDMAYGKSYLLGIWPSNIADRTLSGRGKNGPVPLPPLPLSQGVVPKNPFYLGAILLTPQVRDVLEASHPGSRAALDDVAARAYAGSNYYKWSHPAVYGNPPVRAFADEFAFHREMREATRNLPSAELNANARRAERFEEQLAEWMASAYCHGFNGMVHCTELPVLRQKGVLESLGGDPWIRTHVLANNTLRAQAVSIALQGMPMRLDATGATLTPIGFERFLGGVNGGLGGTIGNGGLGGTIGNGGLGGTIGGLGGTIGGLGGTIGGLGGTSNVLGPTFGDGPVAIPIDPEILFPNPDPAVDPTPLWANGIGLDLRNEWAMAPPVADTTSPTPRLNCEVEAEKSTYRLLACQATNAMLDEIARDNTSCFDKGYVGCDWNPSMFAERFHENQHFMPERTRDYESCVRWTANAFQVMPSGAKANFEALEDYIDDRREAFENFPAPRTMGANNRVASFGQSKTETVNLGDKDSFGGGYGYLVGWRSAPVARKNDHTICRMDFTADATFKAWGSAFDIKRDFIDVAAHLKANKDDDGTASFHRRMRVLGDDLIPEDTVDINFATHPDFAGFDEEITLFDQTYPLPYGFYVNIEAGVELAAGATFLTQATVPPKGSCSSAEKLAVQAVLQPHAKASLYGSASGGWLGIVEAGLEANLDLIRADLPIRTYAEVKPGSQPRLAYGLEGKLTLRTLSGSVDACGCFLMFCGCTEVASWPGANLGSVDVFEPIHAEEDLSLF